MEALKAGEASRLVTVCSQSIACPGKRGEGEHACMLSLQSGVRLFETLWTVAHQAPLSVGFPRQEYWSGLPFPPLGDLLDPGMESVSLPSPALAAGSAEERRLQSLVFQGGRRKRRGEPRLLSPAVCPGTPPRGLPAWCDALLWLSGRIDN